MATSNHDGSYVAATSLTCRFHISILSLINWLPEVTFLNLLLKKQKELCRMISCRILEEDFFER